MKWCYTQGSDLNKVLRLSITKSDSIRRGMRVSHVAACSLQKHTVTGNAVRLMRLVLLVRLETMGFLLVSLPQQFPRGEASHFDMFVSSAVMKHMVPLEVQ